MRVSRTPSSASERRVGVTEPQHTAVSENLETGNLMEKASVIARGKHVLHGVLLC